jgi:hypothetical protein
MFDPGIGWTLPHAIHTQSGERDRLLWNSENAEAIIAPSGRLHVIVPQINAVLLHFTFDSAWHAESLHVRALYATVAEAPDGTRHVAYVGEDPTRSGALDGLLIMHADASGQPWAPAPCMGAALDREARNGGGSLPEVR